MADSTRFLALAGAGLFLLASTSPALAAGASSVAAVRAQALQEATKNLVRPAPRAGAAPNEVFANPYRAYPGSCLNDGLPFQQFPQSANDPAVLQTSITLLGDPAQCLGGGNATECNYSEPVTVTIWRVACSNDPNTGAGQSAVLFELDRHPSTTQPTLYPTFPAVVVTQNNQSLQARLTGDPNTFWSTTFPNSPLYNSDIWVFENYVGATTQFNYNQAFSVTLDGSVTINVPAYNKTLYAAAAAPLPISGYMSSNWYDPQHAGEGMLTQVFDNQDGLTRTFTAAWYTFDKVGLPFWIFAQGSIPIGVNASGSIDTYYGTGGNFAGTAPGGATFTKWGTMSFSFPDCNHMTFTFNGQTDQATQGPGGSGTRTWLRIANVNGLTCY